MENAVNAVIGLVRQIDELERERSGIDSKIASLKSRLAGYVSQANPTDVGRVETVSDRVIAAISADPRSTYDDLAKKVYGSSSEKEKNRLRTAIWGLKKKGSIRDREGGGWEVVAEH